MYSEKCIVLFEERSESERRRDFTVKKLRVMRFGMPIVAFVIRRWLQAHI